MNPIASILATVLGYNRKVRIIKKVGSMLEKFDDLGKDKKTKFGTRSLELWAEHVELPYPKPESVIDGRITIYSPSKDKYAYVTREMDLREWEQIEVPTQDADGKITKIPMVRETIRSLDSDIVFWMQNQMMEIANEKYKSGKTSMMDKFFPYIIVGIFLFLMMLVLVIGWMQIVKPALEVAKGFTTVDIMCDCANGFVGQIAAQPITNASLIPPV